MHWAPQLPTPRGSERRSRAQPGRLVLDRPADRRPRCLGCRKRVSPHAPAVPFTDIAFYFNLHPFMVHRRHLAFVHGPTWLVATAQIAQVQNQMVGDEQIDGRRQDVEPSGNQTCAMSSQRRHGSPGGALCFIALKRTDASGSWSWGRLSLDCTSVSAGGAFERGNLRLGHNLRALALILYGRSGCASPSVGARRKAALPNVAMRYTVTLSSPLCGERSDAHGTKKREPYCRVARHPGRSASIC